MIDVTVYVNSEHRYTGITMTGHAGRADQPVEGQDLVCAAASALTLNMANSVERFTEDPFQADMEESGGDFRFRFTDKPGEAASLLMNSLVLGLEDLADAYGEPYIKIRFEEV
ncbi:MAG: ribosomal-processing cysteine protease Prp [Clostridiales bacterium]|nr:ribosomal-processing cysteine protease Prp [Clostridiales bacterium]